jgi:signal transduction histidine kinase
LDYKRLEAELRKKQEYEAVGKLAFEITHEMKNLLVPIKIFLDLVPERKDEPEFTEGFRRVALTNVDVINKKVEDILFFGKQERLELSPDVDVNQILRDTACGFRPDAKEKNIEITEELDDDLPKIVADRGKLVHVFNNLMVNALEAMQRRTGKIRLRSKMHLNPTGQMKSISTKWIRIEVKDDGEGISPNIRDKIFDAFVTTKMSGPEMYKSGMGLGLAVVKKVIDMHRGIIGVNSEPGKGTTFVIDLPLHQ